jgi:bacterioferritin (cytochrome b1)
VDEHTLRRAAGSVWRARHRFELEAANRFARLSDDLNRLGAHQAVVALTREAVVDETRHASQCSELVSHFGQAAPTSSSMSTDRACPSGLTEREAVLYELVSMACVTETLSCALLGALVERAKDAKVRQVMHEILRDEIRHSRLGWAHLESESLALPCQLLADYLPAMLAGTVNEELFIEREALPIEEPLSGLGSLTRHHRVEIFADAMRKVVFPGLQRYGVDTAQGASWLDSRFSPPNQGDCDGTKPTAS